MARILICGDRNWTDYDAIDKFVKALPKGSVIIQGMCRGADLMARKAALKYGFEVEDYPADWDKHGKAAGVIRNTQMLVDGKPDAVYAFHPDITKSKGTRNMMWQAARQGILAMIVNEEKTTRVETKKRMST